jgi:hypothetical protein
MYGPVKDWYWSNFDGVLASHFLAYSSGTGTVIGITSACETSGALAVFSLKTIVVSSGVSMPEIGLMSPVLAYSGVPTIELKYVPA